MRIDHDIRCHACQWTGISIGQKLKPALLLLLIFMLALLVSADLTGRDWMRSLVGPFAAVFIVVRILAFSLARCPQCGSRRVEQAKW